MTKKNWFRSLLRDTGGTAITLATVSLPVIVGAGGLAIDTIQWTLMQRQMQRQADSAALAGAFAKAQGRDAVKAAFASLNRDNLVSLSKAPKVENVPTSGPYKGNAGAVKVVLETTETLPFSSIFTQPVALLAEATAASITNGTYCVISLEHTTAAGITMQGSAKIDMGCGMATNSKASVAVTAGGSSYVVASHIAAVGGLKSSVSYAPGTILMPYAVPQKDPFRNLPTPVLPACNAQLNVQPNTVRSVSNPTGVACYRGMNIKGTVNFAPGVYYIDGGSFGVGAQAVVTGNGVTFILTSSTAATNPSSIATLDMAGGATVTLRATAVGTYAGVLFYQDRRATNSQTNTINGNSNSLMQGAVYMPSQYVSFTGDSGMITECVQIVSRRVTFIGNTKIVNQCPIDSGAGGFVGTRVYLVG